MKSRRRYIGLAILLTGGAVSFFDCEKVVQSAVVQEKSGDSEEKQEESGQPEGAEQLTVARQVQAPKRYQLEETYMVSIPTEQPEEGKTDTENAPEVAVGKTAIELILRADAEIQVPQVDFICRKKAVPKKADRAEMEKLLEVLNQGQAPLEVAENNGLVSAKMTVKGVPYLCQYSTEGTEKLSWWWNYAGTGSDTGQSADEEEAKLFAGAGDEKKGVTEEEALAFIKELGFQDFQTAGIWSETLKMEEGNVQKDSFQFERVVDGVPVSYVNETLLPVYKKAGYWTEEDGTVHEPENKSWEGEILHVEYTAGVLRNFVYSHGLEISDLSDEKLFLLPFEEIEKIFRDSLIPQIAAAEKQPRPTLIGLAEGLENQVWSQYPYPDSKSIEMTITDVKLGYMRQRKDGSAEEGILTPVWDFYGIWTAQEPDGQGGYEEHTMDQEAVPLMTVDACTGSVVQRMLGY